MMDNRVFVAGCKDYEQAAVAAAVGRVFDAFGGVEAILNGGKRVVVKPNLLMPKKPQEATTTHPAVVEAVCAAFVKAGAEVTVIDSTGGPHTKMLLRMLYGKTGIKEAAERAGATASFDTSVKSVEYPEGKLMRKFELLSPVLDADLVITLAKAKTHSFMEMTGCVKNLFGCIPGLAKPLLHRKYSKKEEFAAMLVDVCERVNPGFCLLDAVYGMEGPGPAGGDPKYLGVIAGGVSPYSVDVAQSYLMGMSTDRIYTIKEAVSRGLSKENPEELEWSGDDPKQYRTSFKPAVKHNKDAVPVILENCTGCGDCVRICPMKCINLINKKAVITEKDCIRCYCCHEFCPMKAIEL